MIDPPKKKELSLTGKSIQACGSLLGVTAALGAMVMLDYSGLITGALFGGGGGLIGSLLAMPFAAMFPEEPL
ncbi:hypothetical protein [Blastopirellula marina]|uniref:Uncharacterized protein n=1 Tax=Blastopirellula marina DSM 3645 TaxID=314230 RepID=A3ZRM5_9BACT|nr:hypothetical protein [Blastopirellula marina]EAQ80794.1 hypothetical protein DSM3645_12276 [Blastopirellula marina DSM 3645]